MNKKKGWPEVKQFYPKNPAKYIGDLNNIKMRSSWEIKFAHWADMNPSVIQWNSEDVQVPYWSSADQKMRTYHLDFVLKMQTRDGIKTMLVEIKPYMQTIKPERKKGKKMESYLNECYVYQVNMDKWQHAKKYAEDRGWQFVILTEEHLYNKKVKK
mgnify:CR=1 FL=1